MRHAGARERRELFAGDRAPPRRCTHRRTILWHGLRTCARSRAMLFTRPVANCGARPRDPLQLGRERGAAPGVVYRGCRDVKLLVLCERVDAEGGTESYLRTLLPALAARGDDVRVLARTVGDRNGLRRSVRASPWSDEHDAPSADASSPGCGVCAHVRTRRVRSRITCSTPACLQPRARTRRGSSTTCTITGLFARTAIACIRATARSASVPMGALDVRVPRAHARVRVRTASANASG